MHSTQGGVQDLIVEPDSRSLFRVDRSPSRTIVITTIVPGLMDSNIKTLEDHGDIEEIKTIY